MPRSEFYFIFTLWLLAVSAEVALVLFNTSGGFYFTLDDPYIHMAVGKSILSGGFGINPSEYSSPSSSIIWPYLMAGTEAMGLGALGPLALSLAAAGGTLWVMARLLVQEGVMRPETGVVGRLAGAVFCILIASTVALPLTGMEHSLHVFLTVLVFAGLLDASKGHPVTPATIVAIVCLPLVRFEGMAFAGAGILALLAFRQIRAALGAAFCILIAMAAYVLSMVHRGLPILPSSVLMKSSIVASAYGARSPLGRIPANIGQAFASPEGLVVLALMATLVVLLRLVRPQPRRAIVYGAVLLAALAHLAVGTYGWFFRYEVYIVALLALSCLVLLAGDGNEKVARLPTARAVVVGLLGIACLPYAVAIVQTPHAALVTFSQQKQMARFAQEFYRKPVAVNDLGLVSYGNPNFVLDLFGLGSEEVRKAKLANSFGPAEMDAAARAHSIGAAMIYPSWFPKGVPEGWQRVGVLHAPVGISGTGDIAIFGTSPAAAADVRNSLKAFVSTLPEGDTLTLD